MSKTNKWSIQLLIAGLVMMFFVVPVMAQEEVVSDLTNIAPIVGEEVTPEDLGVNDPVILADSPFYFIKEWTRNIRLKLTQNEEKKDELRQKFNNQRLFDVYRAIEENPAVIKKVEKYLEHSDQDLEKLKERIAKLKEKNNPNLDKLVEKFTDNAIKHDQILEKMISRIKNNPEVVVDFKDRADNRLGEVLEQFDEEKINSIIEKIIPRLHSLKVLQRVENKVNNDKAKQAIQRARLRKIDKVSESLTPEKVQAFLEELVVDEEETETGVESEEIELEDDNDDEIIFEFPAEERPAVEAEH